ncbi:ATP-binding protein [Paludibacterium purpuratum]|uniref:histidine kinase n=1 Tax=Paludibacterium purpuratum TaxID=1144873 RepID=A0A4R7B9M2_9NEIS|nr:ATP-binding protein [Paludibacterium purpuratum]TDR80692.1 Hpt domain-containing protein [Paludibacterium purpuratum]
MVSHLDLSGAKEWLPRIALVGFALFLWQACGALHNILALCLLVVLCLLQEINHQHRVRRFRALQTAHDHAVAARRQLLAVIEALPEAFAFYDTEDRLALCNQQYANLFSRDIRPEELVGQTFESMKRLSLRFANELPDDGYDAESWVVERRRRHQAGESCLVRTGNQWYLESDHPVPELGYVCLRSNITALKTHELSLQQAKHLAEEVSQAKSAFLAMISHEIRTPFYGILGWLELLSATRLDREQSTMLASMHEATSVLLRLMDDILDFSAIEAGKLTLSPVVAPLRPLLASVLQLFQSAAVARSLSCELIIAPEVASAHVLDPLRVRQILVNFLSNALKHTEQGGIRLTVDVLSEDGGRQHLCFSCIDSGSGLSAGQAEQLFQPFGRAFGQVGTQHGGVGLGLSICRHLAELMGGNVGLQNEPGGGARAWLSLRLDCASVPGARLRTNGSVLPLPFAGLAPVLLVEDNPCNRQLMAMQMEQLAVDYRVAEHGAQALDLWREQRFSLILSDCHMPVMDGYQLVRTVRQEEMARGLTPIPVIACTANLAADVALQAHDAGMSQVLTKPVDLAVLATTLRHWLNLPETPTRVSCQRFSAESGKVLDRSVLRSFTQGDRTKEWRLVRQFVIVGAEDRQALRQAIHQDDSEQTVWYAHRIKGAARMIGAHWLADAAARLEQAARQSLPVADAWQSLERGFVEVEAWVSRQPGLVRRPRCPVGAVSSGSGPGSCRIRRSSE